MGGLTGTLLAMLQFGAIEGVGPSLTGASSLHHRRVGGRIPVRPARRIRGRIRRRSQRAAGGHRDRPAHQPPRPKAARSLARACLSAFRHRRPGECRGMPEDSAGGHGDAHRTGTLPGEDRRDLPGRRAGWWPGGRDERRTRARTRQGPEVMSCAGCGRNRERRGGASCLRVLAAAYGLYTVARGSLALRGDPLPMRLMPVLGEAHRRGALSGTARTPSSPTRCARAPGPNPCGRASPGGRQLSDCLSG